MDRNELHGYVLGVPGITVTDSAEDNQSVGTQALVAVEPLKHLTSEGVSAAAHKLGELRGPMKNVGLAMVLDEKDPSVICRTIV